MQKNKLTKSQRMQLKALICVLGIILLLLLLIGRLIVGLKPQEEPETEPPALPVMEYLTNVWVMEADTESLLIYRDGEEIGYPADREVLSGVEAREQIADLVLTDGVVTELQVKSEKINGKVLSADESGIEIEGYGKLPLQKNYKGYRIYNTLSMCTITDLAFGYNFADFVLDDGNICGILIAREEAMENIRVLLKAADYSGLLHNEVVLTADAEYEVSYGPEEARETRLCAAGEELVIALDSPYFTGNRITVKPQVLTGRITVKSSNRSQGAPSYRGQIELTAAPEGIAVINEVLLEEYLYSVVPSEMPASYPSEALKAQAVCARTYAYGHMQKAGYPQYGAHVDDSTSYQVYNNILEQEKTTTAVKETYGQLLYTGEGELAGTYYYSTSCGMSSDATVWKTEAAKALTYLRAKEISHTNMEQSLIAGENGTQTVAEGSGNIEKIREEEAFTEFITTKDTDDYEVAEGWYRWSYQVEKIDRERMLEVLQKRYQANEKLVLTLQDGEYVSAPVKELDEITALYIDKRGSGGIAEELVIETGRHTYRVISEHNIRYVLCDGISRVLRQDGKEIEMPTILPSAFFILSASNEKKNVVGYTLTGGGFGHGAGMSQNAAKEMAKDGRSYEEILLFFYEGCRLESYEKIETE